MVKNLAHVYGCIAVRPEILRQGNNIGIELANLGVVMSDAIGVGPSAGHEAGARRPADSLLTVGPVKHQSLRGQLVDVRA